MTLRRTGLTPEQKLGWYYRYWNSMNISKGNAPTFIFTDWNTQISNDPLFNKKLKDQADASKKKTENVVNDSVLDSANFDVDLGGFLGDDAQVEEDCKACDIK